MTSTPGPIPDTTETDAPCRQRVRDRRTIILAVLLILAGIANQARSLQWGFLYDDFIHQFLLRHDHDRSHLESWSLYDFGTRPGPEDPLYPWGLFPWWTSPDFKIRFFRPVTSLSIFMDFRLYDDRAPGYHLTSLVLFGVFLALASKLYRDLGVPPRAALWALALLALEDSHVLPVGWIANRNSLLAALFTVATLLAVHHHRQTGRHRYLLTAVVCFLLACGSKESGVIAMPIVGLYLLLLDRPSPTETISNGCRRLLRSGLLWTLILLAAIYIVFYLASGYGTHSAAYCTPWTDPGRFLVRFLARVPLALMSLFFGVSTDIVFSKPHLIGPAVAVSVPALAVLGFILRRILGSNPLAGFALGWSLLALLPAAGVMPSDRLLMNASVGTALLIGLVLNQLGSLRGLMAARQHGRLALAGLLVTTGIVLSVPMTYLRGRLFTQMAILDRNAIAQADIDRTTPAPRSVFLLNSPSGLLSLTMPATWNVIHRDHDTRIFALQLGRRSLDWKRTSPRTMTLACDASPFGDHQFERFFDTACALQPGQVMYQTAAFAATPLVIEPAGVRTVLLEFDKDLDDPSYRFLAWHDGRLARVAPPAVGQHIRLPEVAPLFPFVP